jgi:hypothetical protein
MFVFNVTAPNPGMYWTLKSVHGLNAVFNELYLKFGISGALGSTLDLQSFESDFPPPEAPHSLNIFAILSGACVSPCLLRLALLFMSCYWGPRCKPFPPLLFLSCYNIPHSYRLPCLQTSINI